MCSTIFEIPIDNHIWRGCHQEAGDEKEAKAEASVVSISTVIETSPKPVPDLDLSIGHLGYSTDPNESSLATFVGDQIRRSTTKNFEGRAYITKNSLLQVLSNDVVRKLLQAHITGLTDSVMAKQTTTKSRLHDFGYIEMGARTLLALCVFVNAPMDTFLALLEAGISDGSLPLSGECPTGVDEIDFGCILASQWVFVPYDVLAQPGQATIPNDTVVPLKFDQKSDMIGSGAYSDVFRVELDNDQDPPHLKRGTASLYALKRFKDSPFVEKSFGREYSVLRRLTKIPHDHILLHLAAWSHRGFFYMIFPQARCNLRTFMDEVKCPTLSAENVIWFFKQLRGLADAVRHLHALTPLPALCQFHLHRPLVETDQAVLHNDIKPENVLVLEADDGSPGLFKISDFGCGKFVSKDQDSAAQTTEGFYGTPEYESPDLATHKEASKANDMWALGCVFLELLDWFTIPTAEKQMSFQSQRYTGPGPTNLAFWHRNPQYGLQLKPQVGRKLLDLENTSCYFKRGLQDLLEAVWPMLHVEIKDRWPAERVYNDLNHITRQAIIDLRKDPGYYLRPGTQDGANHLPLTALPTPSLSQHSKKGGYHDYWDDWRGPMIKPRSAYHDWNAINAQVPDCIGHEPYLVDKRGIILWALRMKSTLDPWEYHLKYNVPANRARTVQGKDMTE